MALLGFEGRNHKDTVPNEIMDLIVKSAITQKPTWTEYDDMSVMDTEMLILIESERNKIRKQNN